jgi:hypothetical protein
VVLIAESRVILPVPLLENPEILSFTVSAPLEKDNHTPTHQTNDAEANATNGKEFAAKKSLLGQSGGREQDRPCENQNG